MGPRVASLLLALALAAPAHAQDDPSATGTVDVGELYRRLRPSFVVMRCMGERFGTAFGFGRVGRLVTARHVLACPRGLTAELGDGTIAAVRVVAMGELHDVALLEIVGTEADAVPPLFAREGPLDVGDEVLSIGFPVGPEEGAALELAVTRGIVAQRTHDRLVHDALISPGSSGGPLLDRDGRVVGVSFAVPSGSQVALAVPIAHVEELHRRTPATAGDPQSTFRLGFDFGIAYAASDVVPFSFLGVVLALWIGVVDQVIATLTAVGLVRFPSTLEGGVVVAGSRFGADLDFGYRIRIEGFPLAIEPGAGFSLGNDHVGETRTELMLEDPSCDPSVSRCAVRTYGVATGRDHVLARPLVTLRLGLGPLSLAYAALFDVERVEATEHRITLRVGLF